MAGFLAGLIEGDSAILTETAAGRVIATGKPRIDSEGFFALGTDANNQVRHHGVGIVVRCAGGRPLERLECLVGQSRHRPLQIWLRIWLQKLVLATVAKCSLM